MGDLTAIQAIAGGILIGIGATLLMALTGRIAGVSGITGGLIDHPKTDAGWRLAFLLGMISAPVFFAQGTGHMPTISFPSPLPLIIVGGLLVGFGTRLGSGCTSGHGVCGVARLSWRSSVATTTFILCGALTVYVVRHIVGV